MWHALLKTSKGSATHLWANCVIALSAITEIILDLSDFLLDPEIKDQLSMVISPQWVPRILFIAMIITKLARNRSMHEDK